MPLDFEDLQGVGIKPELIALTGADATPASREGPEEVQVGGGHTHGPPTTQALRYIEINKSHSAFRVWQNMLIAWDTMSHELIEIFLNTPNPNPKVCDLHRPSFQHENSRSKDAFLAKPKGAPKDKLSHYRVAPYYYFQVKANSDHVITHHTSKG